MPFLVCLSQFPDRYLFYRAEAVSVVLLLFYSEEPVAAVVVVVVVNAKMTLPIPADSCRECHLLKGAAYSHNAYQQRKVSAHT